jgi:hypothetical protein
MRPGCFTCLVLAGLVLLTLLAYVPLWENDFIDLDDQVYITQNEHVLGGLTSSGIRWAWTTFHGGFWFPLTWLSLQADASLSALLRGPQGKGLPVAAVFHGQNLLWHLATVVLLFVVWRRLTGAMWRSALVAALFAVHPLHVESVAWATERKDVLSTFFLMLTLLAYTHYVRRPCWVRYLLVTVPFVLGLMAKPMLVTLPCLLLLLDWWPLQRFSLSRPQGPGAWGLVLEKLPLFALAVAASVQAVVTQQQVAAFTELGVLSLSGRLANALLSYLWYLEKTFWPTGLAAFYCHSGSNWQSGPVLTAGLILLGITLGAAVSARRLPWLLVGWLWFLGTLVPVIGLVQIGQQARADRFVYVPHIGLFVALVWSCAALANRLRLPIWTQASLATACLLLLTARTWDQVGYWRNPAVLWSHALAVTTDNHRAHCLMGGALAQQAETKGDVAKLARARRHLEQAISLQP